ncbi:MAG: hypothetical protein ABGY96_22555 [bacterium]
MIKIDHFLNPDLPDEIRYVLTELDSSFEKEARIELPRSQATELQDEDRAHEEEVIG